MFSTYICAIPENHIKSNPFAIREIGFLPIFTYNSNCPVHFEG